MEQSFRPTATAPDWYKDAIIYELRVRSFFDSNGDGIGDFPGLIAKLDYLQDLGVTALWLLPFYPSPLRDDGYDIADYTDVHPDCGTLADFDRFVEEAHKRGLKVITELVLNHTSDQHPWFQRARRAPPGSPERNRYVWSDTPDRYRDARIIFSDFEPSNWSWDPLARAYFWHRFYAHQPDLNFDDPEVCDTMLGIVDFWLARGVDGFRLDAVPYLFEREGTSCDNLPETHAFLRTLRAHMDARFPDRMLLAEANLWPEDAVAYFGHGDECHMAFNFPIMPRIFIALHAEDRYPLVDALAQTPDLPAGCQWALFLRNHDELTLEMVTDEERDAMYRAYAAEPVMRLNLGIRRRLAPLAGNDRRRIELMNALLFALPGTPVVYYGDEIGMGDNVFLGDRHGVRTPMQWSADKNAGFSRANPQRLVLPVVIDPEYHFEAVNVEGQQQTPSSLLWWMKRLIARRKRFRAFGRGTIEVLAPENPRIFAFVRRFEGEVVLMVANLSRLVQFVDLDLSAFQGLVPVELFGHSELPVVSASRYPLTLAGHGFYLLSLEPRAATLARGWSPPVITTAGAWEALLAPEREAGLARVLAAFAAAHTWYEGRGRQMEAARLFDVIPVGEPPLGWVVIVEIVHAGGEKDRYAVPLGHAEGARAAEIEARSPGAVVVRIRSAGSVDESAVLFDAAADPALGRAMLEVVLTRGTLRGRTGALRATLEPGLAARVHEPAAPGEERVVETGRTVVVFGERHFVFAPRRLDEGPSPGLEMSRALLAGAGNARVPPLAAAIEHQIGRGAPATLAVLRGFVPGEADGRVHAQDELTRYYERALAREREVPTPPPPVYDPRVLVAEEPPAAAREVVGSYLDTASLIGRRAAELHLALAAREDDPAFAPEPYSPFDQRGAYQAARALAQRCQRELRWARGLDPGSQAAAERVLAGEKRILERLGAILRRRLTARRTRHHGALELRRVLYTSSDVVIADLDGDAGRPAAERRRKASPLRDVASLIRSLHEAAFATLADKARVRPEDREAARPWADLWWWSTATVLVGSYLGAAREGSFLPVEREETALLLDGFLLEGALSALAASFPDPERVALPLAFLARVLEEA
jgi:maltose alpha-D-glucosyltransferase/alpha-amylase